MSEHTENIKRFCDMDKFAQSICENMTLTEDEANKFIGLLWEQQRCDVAEVKHGEWIKQQKSWMYRCSLCSCEVLPDFVGRPNRYCPNCGAKMDKE